MPFSLRFFPTLQKVPSAVFYTLNISRIVFVQREILSYLRRDYRGLPFLSQCIKLIAIMTDFNWLSAFIRQARTQRIMVTN